VTHERYRPVVSIRARPLRVAGLAILLLGASGCGREEVRLSIAKPRDGQSVRTSKLNVRGTVTPADAEIRVNERPVRLRDGAFHTTVRLHRGRNRINIVAKSPKRTSDIRDIIVKRLRTRAESAAIRRRRAEQRAAAATRAALRRTAPSSSARGRYPASFRRSFMAACQANSNAAFCGCTLTYLESHVALQDLERLQAQLFTGALPRPLVAAATACRSRA
jgi:hypothetical protein